MLGQIVEVGCGVLQGIVQGRRGQGLGILQAKDVPQDQTDPKGMAYIGCAAVLAPLVLMSTGGKGNRLEEAPIGCLHRFGHGPASSRS